MIIKKQEEEERFQKELGYNPADISKSGHLCPPPINTDWLLTSMFSPGANIRRFRTPSHRKLAKKKVEFDKYSLGGQLRITLNEEESHEALEMKKKIEERKKKLRRERDKLSLEKKKIAEEKKK